MCFQGPVRAVVSLAPQKFATVRICEERAACGHTPDQSKFDQSKSKQIEAVGSWLSYGRVGSLRQHPPNKCDGVSGWADTFESAESPEEACNSTVMARAHESQATWHERRAPVPSRVSSRLTTSTPLLLPNFKNIQTTEYICGSSRTRAQSRLQPTDDLNRRRQRPDRPFDFQPVRAGRQAHGERRPVLKVLARLLQALRLLGYLVT